MENNKNGSWKAYSLKGLKPALIISCFMLFVFGCVTVQAGSQNQGGKLEFALIGDTPYDAGQSKEFANVMKEINAADLGFVVHDGDFWFDGIAWKKTSKGLPPCSNEVFKDRLNQAKIPDIPSSLLPVTTTGPIVIGQNRFLMTRLKDWQSCARCFSRVIGASVSAPCG